MRTVLLAFLLVAAAPLAAQPAAPATVQASKSDPVTVEYYYRIKWGQSGEFWRLYKKNHEPILKEMQKRGFIRSMKIDEPLTHMAGGPRWDLRVTIEYRDATAAVGNEPGGWDEVSDEVEKKLYPDKAGHEAEESRRMGLLEEHWDVIVYDVTEE